MDRTELIEMYNQGMITKMEMFIQWRDYDLEPTDEHREEYLAWVERTPKGSPTACIVA